MNILGISAFYHDSAACLVRDGEIVAAAQEERFSRKKHDHRFPAQATEACLKMGGIDARALDLVVFYDKPLVKFERLLDTYSSMAPHGLASFLKAMPLWLRQKLWMSDVIKKELGFEGKVLFGEHHESHAASAFFPSPYDEAAVLTVDGVGEWATTTYGVGRGRELKLLGEIRFPHSLGLLYSAFTYFAGFKVNSGEYKLMGLAPYGEPRFVDVIRRELIDLRDDGSYRLNLKYFDYMAGLRMTNQAFSSLFGGPPRAPESQVTQREMDLARSIQVVTEEAMLRLARHVHAATKMKNLCMAGGVALNCVANGRLLREGPFESIWIQPAAGDAGGALGAALGAWHGYLGHERTPSAPGRDRMRAALLGPTWSDAEIEASLKAQGAVLERLSDEDVPRAAAKLLAEENVVGWFQGPMEFGPRALGARSILGDARSPRMQSQMNLKIKFRESFRPFAPAVLREAMPEWFDLDADSPYMLMVAPVVGKRRIAMTPEQESLAGIAKLNVPRSDIPAVTHVDYSARIQSVRREDHPRYYDLIAAFRDLTGCPVIVNTSFNVRGEPIVCRPEEAYRCLMRTNMDALVIGNFVARREKQPALKDDVDWKKQYELD
ncbi:MAG TPA: carbamoyltransferase [Polyangia bacterium]|nr:carbamoyltransferase [Polyangia bacterium]